MTNGQRNSIRQSEKWEDCGNPRPSNRDKLLDVEAGNIAVTSQLTIEFTNLNYAVDCKKVGTKKKQILHSVSGCFRPGCLTALIGSSGAGKTSLLRIISGSRASNLTGSITVNGIEGNGEVFRRQACYIPQDFALLPQLTVRETLKFSADLKLGPAHTNEFRKKAVNDVAEKLGLLACLDTLAADLSGGERKRLSIGLELMTNPPVMLLDEPTSGLDSAASIQVISVLHSLARAGRTIVCAIHQPGSKLISLFDDIVVLTAGQIVYCGPRDEILDTFASAGHSCPQFYNIAEFVLEVVTTRKNDLTGLLEITANKFETKKVQTQSNETAHSHQFNGSDREFDDNDHREDKSPRKKRFSNSQCRQFIVLFNRAMICARRDNTLTKLRIAAHLVVGLLIGIVFYDFGNDAAKFQSNSACMFTCLLFLFFGNSMPAVQMFPVEASVFLREHMNNWYSLESYYVAKVLADIQMQVFCPTCFLAFAYWLTGQPLEMDRIWRVWVICILLTMLAQSFGIAAGAGCGSQIGVFLVPALNIPMFLFAGFFLRFGEIASYLRPIYAISYFRYAFEGVLQAIYANSRPKLPCSDDFCHTREPAKFISRLGMPSAPFYAMAAALVAWILVLHISVYAVFRWKLYRAMK